MSTLRLGILASGRGSNLQSIMDAAAAGKIGAEVVVVISDNKDAFALERARGPASRPGTWVSGIMRPKMTTKGLSWIS